jgi:hypothetical protein
LKRYRETMMRANDKGKRGEKKESELIKKMLASTVFAFGTGTASLFSVAALVGLVIL